MEIKTSNEQWWDVHYLDNNTLFAQRYGDIRTTDEWGDECQVIPWVEYWDDDKERQFHYAASYYNEQGDFIDAIHEDFHKFVNEDELKEIEEILLKEFNKQ